MNLILNNKKLDNDQKVNERSKLLDKYILTNICCRTNLMTYYQTIKYIK
jgi:DNA-directed RNA polymerase subunit N (RpoN/RPB10)